MVLKKKFRIIANQIWRFARVGIDVNNAVPFGVKRVIDISCTRRHLTNKQRFVAVKGEI